MSQIDNFHTQFDAHDKAVHEKLGNVRTDIAGLKKELEDMRNGNLPPDQQAKLDDILSRMQRTVDTVGELDAMHPPEVPAELRARAGANAPSQVQQAGQPSTPAKSDQK